MTMILTTHTAPDIRIMRTGEVIVSIRVGEVFQSDVSSGGRVIKRWYHSEVPASEQGYDGLGYKTARKAAEALVSENGEEGA